jgi:NAD(P)-dependent dehydrogenase (short-subunit alcohol dehydrogenase family)
MTEAPIAVITGTTHGIGTVTSRELVRAGYTVVMLCRNVSAATTLAGEIRQGAPGSRVEVVPCDLADLSSVRLAARTVLERVPRIDRLINNAGMVSTRHRFSVDGHELTFATNHLGPFLLTRLLLPALAPAARIINVASKVHYRGQMDLDAVDDRKARYSAMAAYSRSKLANVMDTFVLARQLAGSGIRVNCLHPGVVATNLLPGWLNLIRPLFKRFILSPERGARTTLYLALDERAAGLHGEYLDENGQVQPAAAMARERALQEQLLARSARWTGLDQTGA